MIYSSNSKITKIYVVYLLMVFLGFPIKIIGVFCWKWWDIFCVFSSSNVKQNLASRLLAIILCTRHQICLFFNNWMLFFTRILFASQFQTNIWGHIFASKMLCLTVPPEAILVSSVHILFEQNMVDQSICH